MLGSFTQSDAITYMTPFVAHRDGGLFGVSHEFLAT